MTISINGSVASGMSMAHFVVLPLSLLCLSLTVGWAAAALPECGEIIGGDKQKPATGAYGYARLGSVQTRDERCEGRIAEFHAGTKGFVVDTFMVEPVWPQVQSAKTLHVSAHGIPNDERGHVTLLGRGRESSYRMDTYVDGAQPAIWPLDPVAGRLALNWPKLRAIGRVVARPTGHFVFFPVSLRVPGESRMQSEKLILRLRYTDVSPKISAFLGKYDKPGKCAVDAPLTPLREWSQVSEFTELNISLPPTAHAQFCVALRFAVAGADGDVRDDHVWFYFVK